MTTGKSRRLIITPRRARGCRRECVGCWGCFIIVYTQHLKHTPVSCRFYDLTRRQERPGRPCHRLKFLRLRTFSVTYIISMKQTSVDYINSCRPNCSPVWTISATESTVDLCFFLSSIEVEAKDLTNKVQLMAILEQFRATCRTVCQKSKYLDTRNW